MDLVREILDAGEEAHEVASRILILRRYLLERPRSQGLAQAPPYLDTLMSPVHTIGRVRDSVAQLSVDQCHQFACRAVNAAGGAATRLRILVTFSSFRFADANRS